MAGETQLGRAFVEIVVPRAQFESQMAAVGSSFSAHMASIVAQALSASGAIATSNTALVNSYNMVTGSVMGLLSAEELAALSANKLALALHEADVAARLLAAGGVLLSAGLDKTTWSMINVDGAAKATTVSMGSMLSMAKAALPFLAAFMAISKTLGVARGATEAQEEFNKELYQLWTLTDLTSEGIEDLGDEIRGLVYDYNVMAAAGTKAMYQIYSATFTGAEATEIFKTGMKAAAAGVTDLMAAVDMTTTVLNAYGMVASESTRVNDLLFTAIRYGKTTYEELAGQFGRLAGVAAPAGARLEEMTAAIATLTRQGIMTDWAVTSLRQTIMAMFRPTGALAEIIKSLGYETGRALIQTNGFVGGLKMIKEKADATDTPLENLFTNVRAITAVLPLLTTASAGFALDMDRMAMSTGAMEVAFGKVAQSWEYQIQTLKSQINDTAISIGQTLMPAIVEFLKVWATLSAGFKEVAEFFDPFTSFFTGLAGYVLGAAAAAGVLTGAIWLLVKAFSALYANPVVAGISLLMITFAAITKEISKLIKKTEELNDETREWIRLRAGLPSESPGGPEIVPLVTPPWEERAAARFQYGTVPAGPILSDPAA
ncbi:phage tail tape measure protein, partial [Patescibacteria group bacterium]|nr:phage tail tape measure protein [Patescibacteria group bacterium]